MRVFKATYKDRQGRQQTSETWHVEFRDHCEKVRKLAGFSDKSQTESLGRKIVRLVCCRSNNDPLDLELSKWIETMPAAIRNGLARIGLLEAKTVASSKSLEEHLDDYKAALLAKGNTAKHAELVVLRARTLFAGCGFKFWTDIQPAAVEAHLAGLREQKADEEGNVETGLSIQTSNFYLQAAKQFGKWMVASGRATRSAVEHLKGLNVQTDRRHDRRALSVDELCRLLAAACQGADEFGVPGRERALVYRLAVESGLRSNELRSLTRSSFSFAAKLPTVTVEAKSSKRRRRDELPLRADTAAELQAHLAAKHPGAAAFNLPRADNMADMIRRDLAAARAAWIGEAGSDDERGQRERSTFLCVSDEAGRVFDFHSLRHTFLTNLGRSNVHPRIMQAMARHSDPKLTLGRYTHTAIGEQGEALGLLPDLSTPFQQSLRATGTDDRDSVLASCLAFSDAKQRRAVPSSAAQDAGGGDGQECEITRENAEKCDDSGLVEPLRLTGFEPVTYGLGNRCSIP